MSQENISEWCAGLPLVGRRPLEVEEQIRLRQQQRQLETQGISVVVLYLLILFFVTWTLPRADTLPKFSQGIITILSVFVLTIGLPVVLLSLRDLVRRRRSIRDDLQAGTVSQFAGQIRFPKISEPNIEKLRRARLIRAEGETALEILPASGRVWSVAGQPVQRWLFLETVSVAETPAFAALAAQWLEPVATQDGKTLNKGERDLAPAECEELRRFARRLWRRPLPAAIGFTLWCSLPVLVLIKEGHLQDANNSASFTFLVFVTLLTDLQFLYSVRLSRRMTRDAERGRLLILRVDEQAAPIEISGGFDLGTVQKAGRVVEMLPFSRWLWTEDGKPGKWRTVQTP